ncbi:MAG: ABC transporter permease [Candidatus Aminicenantes bacterium]|nr:ABC transporter permease [Candidatus Aminicenantes bacterium]
MIKNYILCAFRVFKKNPSYTIINISGLAIGMACFILIFLWVKNEVTYDRFFENAEQIYRVTTDVNLASGQKKIYAFSTPSLAQALKEDYAEVQAATRIRPAPQTLVRQGLNSFFENAFMFADSNFLDVFSVSLEAGDRTSALKEPRSLLLTREMARKYFGDEDPLGKVLIINAEDPYTITGVLGNMPGNTHFRPYFLAYPGEEDLFTSPTWSSLSVFTYIRIQKEVSAALFEERIQDLAEKHIGPRGREFFYFRLQPITSIHLHSDREGEFAVVVDVMQIYLLCAVAVLILLVACINFINLSTARSNRRAREVGMRKVLGASRRTLGFQFLMESIFSSFLAFLLSLVLVELFLPLFNSLSGSELHMEFGLNAVVFFGMVILVGFLSGIYPAIVLSTFQPSAVLRGKLQKGQSGLLMRKALIVFQFGMTGILLIATGTVYKQMLFMKNKNLGFDKDQIVSVRMRGEEVVRNYEGIKNEMLQNPNILNASVSSSLPGFPIGQRAYIPEGFETNPLMVLTLYVDHEFIRTLGMNISEGRDFSRNAASADTLISYIINKTAQSRFGWENALGKQITCTNSDEEEATATGTVIGVVEDFHLRSLHQNIEPVILRVRPDRFIVLNLKLKTLNITATMKFIENKFKMLQPEFPFEYWFLDDQFDSFYRSEDRLFSTFIAFSLLVVFIACLGLFGLAAFLAEQRTKEIGIRKILGASVLKITWLLTRDFSKWVIISNLISWPLASIIMQNWIQNFSFHTNIGFWILILSSVFTLVIAVLTTSFQAIKASLAHPANSLRFE